MSYGVFNFNFLSLLLFEILGCHKFTLGWPYASWTPPIGEIFFTPSEYFTISNCVFNFNILALVVTEILGESQIYVMGPCASLYAPSGKIFVPKESTLLRLMDFQFQLSSSCIFRDIRGSQIYTRGPYAPWTPHSREIFHPKLVLHNINCVFNFNIVVLVVSDILGGPKFTLGGLVPPSTPP